MRFSSVVGKVFILLAATLAVMPESRAWENHDEITRLSLGAWDRWEDAPFEPLDKLLPDLKIDGVTFASRQSFFEFLGIHADKVGWDEQVPQSRGADSVGLTIVAWSTMTPDKGMDQNLDLSPDQEYMGGAKGPSSQGFRHMYYLPFDWKQPLITFHYPHFDKPLGQAPDRAQLFFDIAVQAKKAQHWFWAYRFLGMSMHYIEDLNQPYHCHQYGSVVLLAWNKIFSGKKAFIDETTRLVGNFHLAFEEYAAYRLHKSAPGSGGGNTATPGEDLDDVFRVPRASPLLKNALESSPDLYVKDGAQIMARAGAMLAPQIVGAQLGVMAEDLKNPKMNLIPGFFDSTGLPKLNFSKYDELALHSKEQARRRDLFIQFTGEALSNTGVAVRWVFDKFRTAGGP